MITPLEIENKKFSKQMMNGYNVDEVDEFLDQIMQDYETNYKELASMKTKVDELNNALEHYKNIENTLQNTLVMAQSTAEEVKSVAKQQADQIISEAQKEAENILRTSKEGVAKDLEDIDQKIKMKEQQFNDVKKQFDVYKAKMESLLISQSEIIKEINKERFELFWKEYPRKVNKFKTEEWFNKNSLTDEQFDLIITKLKKYKDTTDWKKDNGKYIPYPTTWLNQKRWEDDVISISESNNPNNIVKYSDEWWKKLGSDSGD